MNGMEMVFSDLSLVLRDDAFRTEGENVASLEASDWTGTQVLIQETTVPEYVFSGGAALMFTGWDPQYLDSSKATHELSEDLETGTYAASFAVRIIDVIREFRFAARVANGGDSKGSECSFKFVYQIAGEKRQFLGFSHP